MGGASNAAVYDFTPIYSRMWQSVSMAVGYPGCGTAIPCLLHDLISPHRVLPQVGIVRFQNPVGVLPQLLLSLLCPQTVTKCCIFEQCFD